MAVRRKPNENFMFVQIPLVFKDGTGARLPGTHRINSADRFA
jgi:hypothetical protein